MIVEPIFEPSQPAWQKRIDRQFQAKTPVPKASSFDQSHNDSDPDQAPATPAARPWPRVFPSL